MVAKSYDVFVSYASEDRAFVEKFVTALEERGLEVYVDYESIEIGDGIATRVSEGLSISRFCVALFSEEYLQKTWTKRERDAVYAAEGDGVDRLLPVLHGIEPKRLKEADSLTFGRACGNSQDGAEALADRIAKRVGVTTYQAFLASTLPLDDDGRSKLNEALANVGVRGFGREMFEPSSKHTAQQIRDAVAKADLTLVLVGFRLGPIATDVDMSLLEIACEAANERVVLVAHPDSEVKKSRDYDLLDGKPDNAKQARLDAWKTKVEADAQSFDPKSLASTLVSALREWRRRKEPKDGPSAPIRSSRTIPGITEYEKRLKSFYGSIQLLGFEHNVRAPIPLSDVFVPLRAAVVDGRMEMSGGREHPADLSLTEAFWQGDRIGKRRGLILLGHPGSGKTTLLKAALVWMLEKGAPSLGLRADFVPIFLPMRLWRPGLALEEFVPLVLKDETLPHDRELVKPLLEHPRLLLLIDGLDEVADETARKEACAWIGKILLSHPDSYFLVSSRFAGYEGETVLPPEFRRLEVRPLNDEEMETFVRNWYCTVEIAHAEEKEHGEELGEKRADELLGRLRADEFRARRVSELKSNPLLLTAICLVHRDRKDRGGLPKRRAELYRACVRVLLDRWRGRSNVLGEKVSLDTAVRVVQPIAQWLHGVDQRRDAKEHELVPVLEPVLAREKIKAAPIDFLRSARDQSGLFLGQSTDTYRFLHLGFQEYLTALELQSRALNDESVVRDLAKRFGDGWWREVILLSLNDPAFFTRLFREIVKHDAFADLPDLVSECLDDAERTDPAPFLELLREEPARFGLHRLGFGSKPESLRRRQAAAISVLKQIAPEELKKTGWTEPPERAAAWSTFSERGNVELVFIPGGRFQMGPREVTLSPFLLGKYPVTNEQFAEFLAANPGRAQPEFWNDRRWNQPRQPVVGVNWQDAADFCRWSGGMNGNLPTEAQWEYACRAGTTTKYSFEDESKLGDHAWYDGNSGGVTHPVGEKLPNLWGLYDMHGNVWEWCADWYGGYPNKPEKDPGGPPSGDGRVVRGGSFRSDAVGLASGSRGWDRPESRWYGRGFRLCVFPAPSR